ncbi:molybdopterin/thiamine biosynthesis adenylyltransferase [Caulobacter rhizosphaerae]|uniref:Molybdopterin/thiamine biosynthesis adenylyltransferase n=1 Tax=Caulobacter rhizosphaerae TaxID=2010972 RepID=A0ABU1MUF6_9CAUL|nr:ThiF family adenylyltransferase [Caulobacter rhizosphaerae]MDR6529824.1 molybdopterin/thiamine biosynthesis adenylyltransferase [Caulobacter rhizosphaerae]
MEALNGFDYAEFTTRNFGFVSREEQERLRNGAVFVAGVGGMGGACFMALVRAGVGRFAVCDIDVFETSNLNRQVFAFTDTVGQDKAEIACAAARKINPDVQIERLGAEWIGKLDDLAARYSVIVNGADDIAAGVALYRAAKVHGATVIDAYAAPLPSVIVVRPGDPRPEERLGYPTRGKALDALTQDDLAESFLRELEYVLTHSSAASHVDLEVAAAVAAGKAKRMSFAPMVIATGCLMAYEALWLLMGRRSKSDCRGWFFNPFAGRIERPLPWPVATVKGALVRAFMARMMKAAP